MRVLIICGFFETTLQSFRENQIALRLAARGHNVTVLSSTESHIWKYGRQGHKPTDPDGNFERYQNIPNLKIVRRKPYFRIGDLVLFPVTTSDLKGFDVVHVLDFRQGVTAISARIARRLGIPVVYDHEQRGDRRGHLLHNVDNALRRLFIKYGASGVDLVRHTVHANRDFLLSVTNSVSKDQCVLSPLGADMDIFFPDQQLRSVRRSELKIPDGKKLIVCTGRFSPEKRPQDIAKATETLNCSLVFCGSMPSELQTILERWPHVTVLPAMSQAYINGLYNAADCAIFTTFTLSYWEALATGLEILVPRTSFSEEVSTSCDGVYLFGHNDMFSVTEEQYRKDESISEYVRVALSAISWTRAPTPPAWVGWDARIDALEHQYLRIINT